MLVPQRLAATLSRHTVDIVTRSQPDALSVCLNCLHPATTSVPPQCVSCGRFLVCGVRALWVENVVCGFCNTGIDHQHRFHSPEVTHHRRDSL